MGRKSEAKKMRETKVRGILIPRDWEEGGDEIRGIAIRTQDEDEYELLLDDDDLGEMLEYLREEVDVRGHLEMPSDGRKAIRVRSFTPVEYEEDYVVED